MVISKTVQMRVNRSTSQYYINKGYKLPLKLTADGKRMVPDTNQFFTVNVEDLPPCSDYHIEAQCDLCNKIKNVRYVDYNRSVQSSGYYVCKDCQPKKTQETLMRKYGTITPFEIPGVREKAKATTLKNWGTEHVLSSPKMRERIKKTCNEKYGGNAPACDPKIVKKQQETFIKKYGNYCSSYVPEIQEKIAQSLSNSQTINTSMQQQYLYNLLGGKLNYPIRHYNVDICFEDECLVLEYDGGGHNLTVKHGTMTEKEFNQREIKRHATIKHAGYKTIHLISRTDKLPSDSKLLEILDFSRQYFKDYPNHSWIEWHIDDGLYRNAEHKDGVPYDFGELRRIRKEDIA